MPMINLGGAAADLGLGDMLAGQVSQETEEQRKKRMAQIDMNRMMGPEQSLAVRTLFGPMGMGGAGY
jgi:hypothetical protein